MHVAIQEREFVGAERELDRFRFAGIERDAAESAEFFHRARHRADFVANVELDDFVAANRAGVCDVSRDRGAALRADRIGRRVHIRILKGRIAESKAERKERERALSTYSRLPDGFW